jgi:hypothetical protein
MRILVTTMFTWVLACGQVDKGPESANPDGKADSFANPTHKGELPLGSLVVAELTAQHRILQWTFRLDGSATIDLTTGTWDTGDMLDTVMYLYKRQVGGSWGRYIARNDDASERSEWSRLHRALAAGSYRVIVKGYDEDQRGRFHVRADCEGAGCASSAPTCDDIEAHVNEYCVDEGQDDLSICLETPDWGDVTEIARACCQMEPDHVFCSAL